MCIRDRVNAAHVYRCAEARHIADDAAAESEQYIASREPAVSEKIQYSGDGRHVLVFLAAVEDVFVHLEPGALQALPQCAGRAAVEGIHGFIGDYAKSSAVVRSVLYTLCMAAVCALRCIA